MNLTILGCHSATPRENNHTSSQLLKIKENLFLIDCGEGTQIQLRKAKINLSRIKHIFISHLHGDHFYGLIGLISTLRLLGREDELNIYGPKGIKEVVSLQLKLAKSWTDYPLFFHELVSSKSETIYKDDFLTVKTIPLDHRVYTNGFLFTTKSIQRKVNLNAIKEFKLEHYHYRQIQEGKSIKLNDGTVLNNEDISLNPDPPKKYAYCSDTAFNPNLVPLIKGVDLLYHESTFLEKHSELAKITKHSTALQAAKIAKDAGVKKLMLGHYSNRYNDKEHFYKEATKIFKSVILSEDFKSFSI
ncbi:MAG: ribonuclease Z [Flavobacteriaceae bacterium]